MSPVLEATNLRVTFATGVAAVRGISLTVNRGETHCLVGESGCGKSVTALAVMGLLARGARRSADVLRFHDHDLTRMTERGMARLRGDKLAMIFQEPMTSLNPAYTIGSQMAEVLERHRGVSRAKALERAAELLGRVGITAPGMRLKQYPHQLSGGLRQRVMISMALMCDPELLIADEPTTALDVTVQAQILRLLQTLQRELGLALLLITHDLGIVARMADRVSVMYAGEVVESAPAATLFAAPTHPYTRGLLRCIPIPGTVRRDEPLGSIPGVVPRIAPDFIGCAFRDRCEHVMPDCARSVPRQNAGTGTRLSLPPARRLDASRGRMTHAVEVRDVRRVFRSRAGMMTAERVVRAVDGVSFTLAAGDVLGIVGESGCGKSTLARMILGLMPVSAGEVLVDGRSLAAMDRRERARLIQPVFQDPFSSLNPRQRVRDIVGLPLAAQRAVPAAQQRDRVMEMLARVGISAEMADRMPAQLSGGQRQRVAIARALVLRPRIVVCDEPTSALDVSVQAQILNLLAELRRDLGLTYLFISHNLAVVEHIATEVAVMYLGRFVEQAPVDALFHEPRHPYTRALLASVLTPEPGKGIPDVGLGESYPDPANIPPGCRFHPRCPLVVEKCRTTAPDGIVRDGRLTECLLV
ncbi:MAG: ABC transporter ATP-binding protein [Acetobacteraceae bacterium]